MSAPMHPSFHEFRERAREAIQKELGPSRITNEEARKRYVEYANSLGYDVELKRRRERETEDTLCYDVILTPRQIEITINITGPDQTTDEP